MPLEKLKSFGLSSQKSYYIQNLAYLVYNNHLDLKKLKYMTGDEVTNVLIKVKGIGQWTINNYRIFALQDVDAWPSADLALQESIKYAFTHQLIVNTFDKTYQIGDNMMPCYKNYDDEL